MVLVELSFYNYIFHSIPTYLQLTMVKYCPTFQMLHNLLILIAVCIICHVHCKSSGEDNDHAFSRVFLRIFQFSHMGGISGQSFCPENGKSFIIGTRIRLSNFLNQTHPTVNAMDFLCSDAIRPSVPANGTIVLQRNIGNWSVMKVCPNGGFVTGITVYMQTVTTQGLVVEEDTRNFEGMRHEAGRFFDVFELGKSRYISGISLNCSWNIDYLNDFDGLNDDNDNERSGDLPAIPAWRDTVTLGRTSGMGLRLYCTGDRAISGIITEKEALLTYDEGERWIPLELITRCSLLPNPVRYCYPELDWEKVEHMTCLDTKTREDVTFAQNKSGTSSAACEIPHFVGISPNDKIENKKSILRAYLPVNLEGRATKLFVRYKLFSKQFMNDWQHKYKLEMGEYNRTVRGRPPQTYMKLAKETYVVNFTDVNYDEPEYCRLIRRRNETEEEPLKYDFYVKQLVGYCSIYKIYFPLFRKEYHRYFERKIDGIRTRVIFPTVDASTNVDDILETKFVPKL